MQCMFRIPSDGGRVLWELTNKCNYNCKYCIFNSGKCFDEELSLEEIKKVIDQLLNSNFKYLKFTGGEPFTRKDIIEILSYASSKKIIMDISTNASLITSDMVQKLKKINLSMIHVSLDGPNADINDILRNIGSFDKTIKGINLLKESNKYLRIGTVIFKDNEDYLEEMVKLSINLNVNEIIFSIMEPVGRMLDNYELYKTKSMEQLTEEIEKLIIKYPSIVINYNWNPNKINNTKICPAGEKFIYINNKGNIAPCSWLVTRNSKYLSKISLKTNSLEDVFHDENMCNFLKLKGSDSNNECPSKRDNIKSI